MYHASWGRKFVSAIGSVAYGVKDNGFSTFLMLYFNQVLGLPAIYVGVALLIAMAVDAISDPLVGHWSDHFRSRLGRRHPFMYAAIIPTAFAYYFLWNPVPGLGEEGLFLHLVLMAVLVRLTITFFEVPNSAFVVELEPDYDKRTGLAGLRTMLAYIGGIAVAIIAYAVFLVPTAEQPIGTMNVEGYQNFAIFAAVVMVIATSISAFGTRGIIDKLPQARRDDAGNKQKFGEAFGAIVSNSSFRNLFVAQLMVMMVTGTTMVLQLYFGTILFGLSSAQLGIATLGMLLSAFVAVPMVAIQRRNREKRTLAIWYTVALIFTGNTAVALRLVDLMPETGSDAMLIAVTLNTFIGTVFLIAQSMVTISMMADLVEQTERDTGHRSEGLYFAALSFTRKLMTGLGMFFSSLLLMSVQGGDTVMDEAAMVELGWVYIPVITGFYIVGIWFLKRYSLTREQHEDNLVAVQR